MGEIVPDPRDKVQAAVTAAEVLKALGRHGIPAPLSRIANSARIAPAKAHRYLQALIETGLAVQDPRTGHYGLGSEMVVMGAAALGRLDLVQVATEPMMALRETTGATCLLSVWSNHGPTAVRVLQSLSPITVVTKLGSVLPLRSATGLVFAAHLPEAELRAAQDYKSLLNSEIDGVA